MAQNPVRPGNREKGWNDPPEFLHSADDSSNSQIKRTQLNKRVAHTLDGLNPNKTDQNVSEMPTTVLNAPPIFSAPPTANIPPIKPIDTEKSSSQNNATDSITVDEISIDEIENILNNSVKTLKDNELGSKICEDILKRIKIFVTNWPKLNPNVKAKMHKLAQTLARSEYSVANDIHLHLILDYPSEVSQWMVGFKKLIHELINFDNKKQQQVTIDTSESAQTL